MVLVCTPHMQCRFLYQRDKLLFHYEARMFSSMPLKETPLRIFFSLFYEFNVWLKSSRVLMLSGKFRVFLYLVLGIDTN